MSNARHNNGTAADRAPQQFCYPQCSVRAADAGREIADPMESHDYPIEHFKMMAELATRLKSIPALILEHSYSYESFGSWWFIFKRAGGKCRVVFDGRDKYLTLERAVIAGGSKTVAEWQTMNGKQLADVGVDGLTLEICSLIGS